MRLTARTLSLASWLVAAPALVLSAQDPEAAGLAAEQAGRLKEAFQLYLQALQALPDPPPSEADLRLRERVVKLAPRLDPPPAVPEEAERAAVRGQVIFTEAKDTAGYERAAAEFRKAIRAAPWFSPALFNLALVQQKLGQYQTALGNMELYLATGPADADQARAKLYELEYQAEQKAQRRRLIAEAQPKLEAAEAELRRLEDELKRLWDVLSPDAKPRWEERVSVKRRDVQALKELANNCEAGDAQSCASLLQGLGPKVHVSGDVVRAGSVPFRQGMTVEQALALAGGVNPPGSTARFLIRLVKGKEKKLRVNTADTLEEGDTLLVRTRP